jgi:hypothetical protein
MSASPRLICMFMLPLPVKVRAEVTLHNVDSRSYSDLDNSEPIFLPCKAFRCDGECYPRMVT